MELLKKISAAGKNDSPLSLSLSRSK